MLVPTPNVFLFFFLAFTTGCYFLYDSKRLCKENVSPRLIFAVNSSETHCFEVNSTFYSLVSERFFDAFLCTGFSR